MPVLTLDEAKIQLNITGTSDDAELQTYVDAVTPVVEHFVGPVDPRTVVERHDAGGGVSAVVLRSAPVLSLTSVVGLLSGGSSYDVAGLLVDPDTGEVRRTDGGRMAGLLQVTYVAGRSEIPPPVALAGRMLVQHLWRTQRAGGRGPLVGGGDDYSVSEPVPGLGYAVPNRVVELLAPWRLPPGVA